MRKNPSAYGIPGNKLSESGVEKVLKDQLVLSNVRELAKYGMVRVTSSNTFKIALLYLLPLMTLIRHMYRH